VNAPTQALVTFIMPVWNPQAGWLRQAVESVLAQRECTLELVVVDDGCPRPVAELLAEITDERVRHVRIPHGGPSAARNAGIAEARGRWVRFVDADDVLEPSSTAHLAGFMRSDEIVAYGATLVCDEQLRAQRVIASALRGSIGDQCLLGQFDVRLPAMLLPRRVVDAVGAWNTALAVSGDWDFVLRALDHAAVDGDQRVALFYRRHAASVSRGASLAAGETARRRIIEDYFVRHPERRGSPIERQAHVALYLDRGRAYWRAGHRGRAAARLGRSFWLDPFTTALELRHVLTRRRRAASGHDQT
jgi:glycosyltransferase involved in cell wall biosynthesis